MLLTIALLVIFVSAPVVFTLLFFVAAPYGRHFREGWGPSITARAGWMVMEAPALLVIGFIVLSSGQKVGPLILLLLGLWEVHYLYRTCLFPVLMRGGASKRFPLLLVGFAFIFNSLNGYANGTFLATTAALTDGAFLSGIRVCAGVALFAAGFLTHVWADRDLRRLRKPGEIGYRVPRGGLWEYVSNPNYFGEITEWCGWALATWSLPGLAFALFTIANLVPRAWANRRWYIDTFADYPRQRKSVIPFVF
jgi:3-oxo-5-alpha-steroid 4-dehydrogenase 1